MFANVTHPYGSLMESGRHWIAGLLAQPLPPLRDSTTCAEAFDWFNSHTEQPAAAIVDRHDRVIGMANRLRFLARYAERYVPEIYGKRSIRTLANLSPMIVDEDLPLQEVTSRLVLDHPDALRECFVVTRQDRYFGIGTCESLVRCKLDLLVDQQARLEHALLAARQASEAKSNFLAQMSHELRTPLNAIIGFSDIISKELFGGVGRSCYKEYASDILAAGQHLLELINNLLDLSKAEAGKLELCDETFDVAGLCEECIRLVLVRAREQQVRLITSLSENLPGFRADRLRIKQILVNLLSNATKFTPEGGTVELCAQLADDGGFEFQVSDTGIGMAPEMIPVALEPFRQLGSRSSARSAEGTGLGLSLAKSLTEQHGGTMMIDSEPDKGTRVTMHFPPDRTEREMPGTDASTASFEQVLSE